MTGIRIEVETGALEGALETIGSGATARAIARAINRTATSVRANVLRELSAQVGLTQRELRGRTRIQRVRQGLASRLGSGREGVGGRGVMMRATVTASGSDITATAFQAKQTRRGVSFKPGRKAKRRSVPGAFLATVPGRRAESVFLRATDSANVLVAEVEGVRRRRRVPGRSWEQTDIPIAKLVLPGVSRTLFDEAVQASIAEQGTETLTKRLQESVEKELLDATKRETRRRARPRGRR